MLLPLLIGIGAFLGSLLSYGMATALIVHIVVRLIRSGYTGLGFWKNVAVMTIVSLVTAAAHLIQIALWAVALLLSGEITTFEAAFYYSAENYTALGYGDIVLSERWQLLGPLEAINGLLLFGLSTAVMFAVMSRLIANHLRQQLAQLGEEKISAVLGLQGRSESTFPGQSSIERRRR
ncbi:MAG TPA: ion channel [Gemmataceae bacterium]|nr:ion channel [Gemmataceae bacterium]